MKYTYFCKKGGVGKTTICAEHASYLASQGKKVLIVSTDDQNSVFEIFGKTSLVFDKDDNYFEHYLIKEKTLDEILLPLRDNVYAIKTFNTDMLSKKLTLERPFEKSFLESFESACEGFDAVFVDMAPASNRITELILELVDKVIVVVELDKLGLNGFYNTVQYFVDCGVDTNKIKYILPNGFIKRKSVPVIAMDELKNMADEILEGVEILPSIPEKSVIQVLQHQGVSMFDANVKSLSSYARGQKKDIANEFAGLFDTIGN